MELIFLKDKKTYLYSLLTMSVFLLSYLGFLNSSLNYICFWLIIGAVLFLTFKKLEYGVLIAVLELIIGSKGYLFSFPVFNYVVSLRLAIFLIIMFVYLYGIIRKKEIKFFRSNLWLPFAIFCIFLLFGFINGLIKNSNQIVFYDINAYFYLALIFPFFDVFFKKENIIKFIKVLTIGVISLSLFTFILLLDFGVFEYSDELISATKVESKQLEELKNLATLPENARLAQTTKLAEEKLSLDATEITEDKPAVYRWLKDLGLAEVSYIGGRFFRIFSPSQFYVVIYLILLITYSAFKKIKLNRKILNFFFIFIFGLVLLISYSRSFWLGFIISFLYIIFSLPKRKIFQALIVCLLFLGISIGLLYLVSPASLDLLSSRITSLLNPSSELAASNRVSLMNPILEKIKENPLQGSGFGTLVTFKSLIPGTELVEYIKVYLYEWAYLDIIVKIGFFGLIFYLYFIYFIYRNGHKVLKKIKENINQYIFTKSLIAGLIFLLVTHLTTPFLNHPLGLGYLLIIAPIFYLFLTEANEVKKSIN